MASMTPRWLRCAFVAVLTAVVAVAAGTVHLGPATAGPARAAVAERVRTEIASKGEATFLVRLDGSADLAPAERARGKARAARVLGAKTSFADRSQAGLRRMLRQRGADFSPYWIVNAIRVTGDAALLDAIAARPEVREVLPDRLLRLPVTTPGRARPPVSGRRSAADPTVPAVAATEWNIDGTGAARVWSQLGVRGEGVVVANIDTGVQADHPALAASYRGRGGTDDYNWFDPARVCPSAAPCDNNGHGTHTMGTMVGAGDPGVGMAPGARWIAAKGCETSYCSTSSLLAAGQWIVAPTDRDGANPRPDLAPDIVNNSWGSSGLDPWYREVTQAWVTAGIFPAFAAGNSGPRCTTVGSPGGYDISYATGALAADGTVAPFSSRGATADGLSKPDITAPGVDVRSTVPDGEFEVFSGTSMASPHTAAAVALLWSASPALRGDIAATREVLDATAIDVADTSCGGTAARNNVYGDGRLDAYAAVASVLSGSGSLAGRVDAGGGAVPGATVTVTGPVTREVPVDTDGRYRLGRVPAGGYTVAATAFGYRPVAATAEVTAGSNTVLDLALSRLPYAVLSGTVSSGHGGLAGVALSLVGTPVVARTDDSGRYRMEAPLDTYRLSTEPAGGCATGATRPVTVAGDTVVDVVLAERSDGYGYTCGSPVSAYRSGDRLLDLTGDDAVGAVTLPFPFPLYGVSYTQAWISTNGLISFAGPAHGYANSPVPEPAAPNAALYPFWDDLVVDDRAGVYLGESPDGYLVEWRDVAFFADSEQRMSISATLGRDGSVTYRYRGLSGAARSAGGAATIGLENETGTTGFAYSVDTPVLRDDTGLTFHPPAPS